MGKEGLIVMTAKMKKQQLSIWVRIRRNWGLYLMLLPAVVLLICFTYRPMYGVLIAFKDYRAVDGILGSEWADPWYKYFKHGSFQDTKLMSLERNLHNLLS